MSDSRLYIGALLFEQMDQLDFTGPFEVLARVPDSVFYTIGKTTTPIRDARGLLLTPERTLADVPQLDALVVPGGNGVNALMEDEEVLNFLRRQAAGVKILFSVCTGTLVCGAAGLLQGRKASHALGLASPAEGIRSASGEGACGDGWQSGLSLGVTSGIDGALTVAALLRDDDVRTKNPAVP